MSRLKDRKVICSDNAFETFVARMCILIDACSGSAVHYTRSEPKGR
jgi:hypothetical protein